MADPAHLPALSGPAIAPSSPFTSSSLTLSVSSVIAGIRAHLCAEGWTDAEPLRWAITAVEPGRGLQLEGVALQQAVVLQQAGALRSQR
ncbi:MAG: hypothetical protein ACKOXO_08390 [Cyanobium sp.]